MKTIVEDETLRVVAEGRKPKFVPEVEEISFNGQYALEKGQEILYITERCVFQLTQDGLEITEIAPGINLYTDVLGKMGFVPRVSSNLKILNRAYLKTTPLV